MTIVIDLQSFWVLIPIIIMLLSTLIGAVLIGWSREVRKDLGNDAGTIVMSAMFLIIGLAISIGGVILSAIPLIRAGLIGV